MAIRGAVRWKPDTYRQTTSTTIQDFDPSVDPPRGGVVMTAQAVVYDDTKMPSSYRPGSPDTEQNVIILYEEPIVKDLAVFVGMTQAQAAQEWENALNDFKNRILPAAPVLVRAIYAARTSPPILIG